MFFFQKMLTGEIEVTVVEFEVLNPAKPNLPFLIRDHNKVRVSLYIFFSFYI